MMCATSLVRVLLCVSCTLLIVTLAQGDHKDTDDEEVRTALFQSLARRRGSLDTPMDDGPRPANHLVSDRRSATQLVA